MKLDSISFTEYSGEEREWVLESTTLDVVTLIVGKNAAGKSRFLSIISSLAKMLSGTVQQLFESGDYTAKFSTENDVFEYTLIYKNKNVIKETFSRNGISLLDRGENGAGTIRAEKLNETIDFQAPTDQLAARVRRDAIQHPFFEDLHEWASTLRHYLFGTPLGRDHLAIIQQRPVTTQESGTPEITDPNEVTRLYMRAYEEYLEEFDRAILRDMESLGYKCTAVGVHGSDGKMIQGPPMALLYLKEEGLKSMTSQLVMSQGMFRALSLVIHINYCVFRKQPRTILIDDIGEGLDYSRSQSFISLLIERCIENSIQLIMTSNDRFVMNRVPLRHWGVLTRASNRVHITNAKNSPQVFEEFEELGLSNFDFFSNNFFEEGVK